VDLQLKEQKAIWKELPAHLQNNISAPELPFANHFLPHVDHDGLGLLVLAAGRRAPEARLFERLPQRHLGSDLLLPPENDALMVM
jgi:hypothetical protein